MEIVEGWVGSHQEYKNSPFDKIEVDKFFGGYFSYPEIEGVLVLTVPIGTEIEAKKYLNSLGSKCSGNARYQSSNANEILSVLPERVSRVIDLDEDVKIDLNKKGYTVYFKKINGV